MAKTARLEIRSDQEFIDILERISRDTRKSKADVIREAVALYTIALEEGKNNREIVFRDVAPRVARETPGIRRDLASAV
jgi:hypothetical protein